MKARILAAVLTATMAFLMFSACGNSKTNEAETTTSTTTTTQSGASEETVVQPTVYETKSEQKSGTSSATSKTTQKKNDVSSTATTKKTESKKTTVTKTDKGTETVISKITSTFTKKYSSTTKIVKVVKTTQHKSSFRFVIAPSYTSANSEIEITSADVTQDSNNNFYLKLKGKFIKGSSIVLYFKVYDASNNLVSTDVNSIFLSGTEGNTTTSSVKLGKDKFKSGTYFVELSEQR